MTQRMSRLGQVCDLQLFAALNGKVDMLCTIAPVFVHQAEHWLQQFATAMAEADQVRVLELLHKMRGSSASICAIELREAIQDTERLVKADGVDASNDQLKAIAAQLSRLNLLLGGLSD